MKFGILICKPGPRVPHCCDRWESFEVSWSKHTTLSHPVKDASTELCVGWQSYMEWKRAQEMGLIQRQATRVKEPAIVPAARQFALPL